MSRSCSTCSCPAGSDRPKSPARSSSASFCNSPLPQRLTRVNAVKLPPESAAVINRALRLGISCGVPIQRHQRLKAFDRKGRQYRGPLLHTHPTDVSSQRHRPRKEPPSPLSGSRDFEVVNAELPRVDPFASHSRPAILEIAHQLLLFGVHRISPARPASDNARPLRLMCSNCSSRSRMLAPLPVSSGWPAGCSPAHGVIPPPSG